MLGFISGKISGILKSEVDLTLSNRGLSYMSIFTTPKERSSYVSGIGTAWALGTILGPVISGAFADSDATWRWVSDGC